MNQAYTETPFVAAQSLNVLTAAVVGGLGSLSGALIGAIYLQGGIWFLPEDWRLLPVGRRCPRRADGDPRRPRQPALPGP